MFYFYRYRPKLNFYDIIDFLCFYKEQLFLYTKNKITDDQMALI